MTERSKKIFTAEEVRALLEEYIEIDQSLWDYAPIGSHIRYLRNGTEPFLQRFRRGGFIRNRYTNDRGKKMIMLETSKGGKAGTFGYSSWPIAEEDLEKIWKKYPDVATIELHLINGSLSKKKAQIEELSARIDVLASRMDAFTARMDKTTEFLRIKSTKGTS